MTWSARFEDPVSGLTSLRDAATYIEGLPKAEQNQPHWQTAIEMLIKAAEGSPAWMMMASIAMLRAINHGKERVFRTDRKETHWGKRKLKLH